MSIALFPASLDPITYGHKDIIEQYASAMSENDQLIVGIGRNIDKKGRIDIEQRRILVQSVINSLETKGNISVEIFEGSFVHFAYQRAVDLILRGVRDSNDECYENSVQYFASTENPFLKFIRLKPNKKVEYCSSTGVMNVLDAKQDITPFVPVQVKQYLEEQFLGQKKIAIVGQSGAGKTYISKAFSKFADQRKVAVHTVNFDDICHTIYKSPEARHLKIRKDMSDIFGEDILHPDGTINNKTLRQKVMNENSLLAKLNTFILPKMGMEYQMSIRGKEGIILLDAPTLIQNGNMALANNNILYVSASQQKKIEAIKNRDKVDKKTAQLRLSNQPSDREQIEKACQIIHSTRHGNIWKLQGHNKQALEPVFEKILAEI